MATPAVRVRGLRHVALKVRDVQRAAAFYADTFGMEVTWAPDPENVYLTSGTDSLALHEDRSVGEGGALDHLGFLVASAADVYTAADALQARAVPIVNPPRMHRDGSVSCYCRDPDGNLIQILYHPGIPA